MGYGIITLSGKPDHAAVLRGRLSGTRAAPTTLFDRLFAVLGGLPPRPDIRAILLAAWHQRLKDALVDVG